MRKRLKWIDWLAIAAFALLVGTWLFLGVTSKPPAPRTGEQIGVVEQPTSNGAERAQHYGGGTEESPFVVKVEHAPTTQAEAEKDAEYRQREAADKRVIWWAGAAVLVGLGQAVALFGALLITAFVAIRQLRAYIFPSVRGLRKFNLTEPIEITIRIRNAGQTPAKDCESTGVVFVGALPLDDDAKMAEPTEPTDLLRHSKPAIYPQGEHNFDCVSIDLLGPEIIEGLRKRIAAIYVAGEVRYKDMFGLKRRSEFCLYIDPDHTSLLIDNAQGKGVAIPAELNFVAAHVWNRVT